APRRSDLPRTADVQRCGRDLAYRTGVRGIRAACCVVAASLSLWPAPDAATALFSSYSPVNVSLKAPFDDLFAMAQKDPDYSVKGVVAYTDTTGKAITIDGVD